MNRRNRQKARVKAEKIAQAKAKKSYQAKLRKAEKIYIQALEITGEYPNILGTKVMKHRPKRNSKVRVITSEEVFKLYQ